MKSAITYEYGHCCIAEPLWQLLQISKAEDDITRYTITGIYVTEGTIVVSDGQRLLKVNLEHKIESMIYKCVEGWLIGPMEGNFPKYQDIIPDIKESKIVCELATMDGISTAEQTIFAALANAGYHCNAGKLLETLGQLTQCAATDYKFYVNENDPDASPLLLTCDCWFGSIKYVQMPVRLQ